MGEKKKKIRREKRERKKSNGGQWGRGSTLEKIDSEIWEIKKLKNVKN